MEVRTIVSGELPVRKSLSRLAAFTLYTQTKYGTTNYYQLFGYYTPEEKEYGNALFFHVPGDPLPVCPDPGFSLEEWLEKVE